MALVGGITITFIVILTFNLSSLFFHRVNLKV